MRARIEVGLKSSLRDSHGETVCRRINTDLHLPVDAVRTVKVFTVDAEVTEADMARAATGPFCDPVIQEYAMGGLALKQSLPFDWLIEVGFRPGVTDNEGRTAAQALGLLWGRPLSDAEAVYTSTQFLIAGALTRPDAERIASELLSNELIQRVLVFSRDEAGKNIEPVTPRVTGTHRGRVAEVDLEAPDEELMRISRDGILALSLKEMKIIRDYFRDPAVREKRAQLGLGSKATDIELECLAQTWSEHCKHKIFTSTIHYVDEETGEKSTVSSLFDTYIRASTRKIREAMGANDWCRSVFKDNAGVIRFNNDWNVAFKVETHNSPSALDPYGGALTGIVGVNRDPFGTGMGAKLVCNTDVFCFASPFYDKPLPKRLLHPRRIFEGVREGVEHGGNKSGIPTVNGSLVFDDRYAGKPLVFCGTVGIMPRLLHGRPSEEKKALAGDRIVMTGGRIGKDGIHGATFSSEELHAGSPATAVQIGDPITQKKMFDFLLKARDLGLYRSITDNGAGGLSSSVGEMAEDSGGFELHLDRAPLKYAGLDPWEIFVSEAQERMTLAVPPEKLRRFMELAEKMDVEATDLGRFTDSGLLHLLFDNRTIGCMAMEFVHNGLPKMELDARWRRPVHDGPLLPDVCDIGKTLHRLLGRLNICSKEYVVRQYDHEVQGGSVVKPLTGAANDGPSDAAVLRPVLESMEGLVLSHGICPRYSDLDTYNMVACAVDEAVRNAVAVGAGLEVMAGLDNFCWCDPVQSDKTPDGHYKLAQLVRANRALYDYTVAFGVPCISGKDSMKNDYHIGDTKISIPPTLLFSVVAHMDDVGLAVTMDAKRAGDLVYVSGVTLQELGGSEYAAMLGAVGAHPPTVDAVAAKKRYQALHRAMRQQLVASCHDCSDGGLGVALAETAFAGDLGMEIDLAKVPRRGVERDDLLLFSESQSRFVITVHLDERQAFESAMAGTQTALVGTVTAEPVLSFHGLSGGNICRQDIMALKKSWQEPLAF